MSKNFKNLTLLEKELIIKQYKENPSKQNAQELLASHFGVTPRAIRKWANKMSLNLMNKNIESKILIYDIETSLVEASLFWTGKQYVSHKQLMTEPRIITISYKWLGEDEVYDLKWDMETQDDKSLLLSFLPVYNRADLVVGQNNNYFDNRWINARAIKHGLFVNLHTRSHDIMREMKRIARIPSYSMDYMTKLFGVSNKMENEGRIMWEKIQYGTPDEQQEYMSKMIAYNRQDVVATEALYIRLRMYLGHKIHLGVLTGREKFTCPQCGGYNIDLYKTTITPAGTIQRVLKCEDDNNTYKVSNKIFIDLLKYKMCKDE